MNAMRTLLFVTLLVFATPVSAQLNGSFLGNQPNITASPEFPRPGELTEVELKLSSSQLFDAEVIWTINNQVITESSNRKKIKFMTGNIGSVDRVTATVVRDSGITRNYSINVQPTYVDIILEPQTRTPDFYQGRAVPSIGSQINATVLVNNGEIAGGSDLTYDWRLNNQVVNSGLVRGAGQISFDTPRGSKSFLSVQVSDTTGRVLGRRSIYFQSVTPDVVFYETNALYGKSHNAISKTLVLTGSAATIVAEPYNMDIRTYNQPDISEWSIDNKVESGNSINPYLITIQKVAEGGTSKVSFHVRSTSQLLQGSKASINIVF